MVTDDLAHERRSNTSPHLCLRQHGANRWSGRLVRFPTGGIARKRAIDTSLGRRVVWRSRTGQEPATPQLMKPSGSSVSVTWGLSQDGKAESGQSNIPVGGHV